MKHCRDRARSARTTRSRWSPGPWWWSRSTRWPSASLGLRGPAPRRPRDRPVRDRRRGRRRHPAGGRPRSMSCPRSWRAAAGVVALLALLAPLTRPRRPCAPGPSSGTPTRPDRWTGCARSSRSGDRKRHGRSTAGGSSSPARSPSAPPRSPVAAGGSCSVASRSPVPGRTSPCPRRHPGAAALPAGADLAGGRRGPHPVVHRERRVLPDRHRASSFRRSVRADYRLDADRDVRRPAQLHAGRPLRARTDLIERDITLTCVSNEVGGTLVGTARWLGVPLGAFLRENGVRPESSQLVCRSRRRHDHRGAHPLRARGRGRDAGHRDER